MNKKNPFLRPRAKSPQPQEEIPLAKPTAEMSDAELEDGLQKARRELLDLRHEELRIREKARVAPSSGAPSGRPNLSSIFKKKGFR